VPLLGLDLLSQLKAQILLPPGDYLCCPFLQEQLDPTVWTDGLTVEEALPVQVKLKYPSQFPHQKQYSLKPEGREGLLSIINSLKKQGPVISCSSPYNTLFLTRAKQMKQSFPSTQLFPIPILYWLKYPQNPNITLY
jgi:hypothetical protein